MYAYSSMYKYLDTYIPFYIQSQLHWLTALTECGVHYSSDLVFVSPTFSSHRQYNTVIQHLSQLDLLS